MSDAKNYVKSYGKDNIQYLLLGTTDSTLNSNSPKLFQSAWKDAHLSVKVTKNDVIGVVPNISWNRSSYYSYWRTNLDTSTNYYVYVPQTRLIYLCISNNPNNRIDEDGDYVSTITPTHSYGKRTYEDGYTWLPVFRVNSDIFKYLSNDWIPIVSFDFLDIEGNQVNQYRRAFNFCSDYGTGVSGNCGIYFNEDTQLAISDNSYVEYSKGDLFTTIPGISCSNCFHLFDGKNDKYTSVFFGSDSADLSISIKTKLEEVEDLIQTSQLSPNSSFYSLYDLYENNQILDGAIISAFIDLEGLSESDLISTVENPSLIVNSVTGEDASIRLKTYINLSGNYEINGIEVLDGGSGYKDVLMDINQSYLSGISSSTLMSRIIVNTDLNDYIGFDPYTTLNCSNILTNVTVYTRELADQGVFIPNEINFYSLIENPIQITGSYEFKASKSTSTPYTKEIKPMYTEFATSTTISGGDKTNLEDKTKWSNYGTYATDSGGKKQNVKIIQVRDQSSKTRIKVVGDFKDDASSIDRLTVNGINYVIDSVVTKPTHIQQFSGNQLKANVFTTRSIQSDDNSTNVATTFRIITPKG
jgi:hypothetical protein